MTFNRGDVVVRNEQLLTTEIDDEIMAMNVARGECYGLDRIGSRIWAMIEQPRQVGELCATLMEEFEVDAETCWRDIDDLLKTLRDNDLVTVRTG
jgi:hypothetical protein